MSLIPYVLPPFNEQKRIAEKVERLLSKIEEAKQLIEEAKTPKRLIQNSRSTKFKRFLRFLNQLLCFFNFT